MAVWVFPTILFFAGIFILIGLLILLYKSANAIKKIDIDENAPHFECESRKKFTGGYARGLIKKMIPCANNCTLIVFVPTDVKQGLFADIPKDQYLVVANEYLQRIPSEHREIIRAIPKNLSDIPEIYKSNPALVKEYTDMRNESVKAYIRRLIGEEQDTMQSAFRDHVLEYRGGLMSRELIRKNREIHDATEANNGNNKDDTL